MKHGSWKASVGIITFSFLLTAYAGTASRPPVRDSARRGVFAEPLVPFGPPDKEEGAALEAALRAYAAAGEASHTSALEGFLRLHPTSPWRVSLLTNIALAHEAAGDFSKAIDALETVRGSHVEGRTPEQKALVDRALGELLRLHTRLGHLEQAKALLEALGSRTLTGPATEAVANARIGLWELAHEPGQAYRCGAVALADVLPLEGASSAAVQALEGVPSPRGGFSIARLADLANSAGVPSKVVFQNGDAIPVPSVVHWKVGHYGAILGVSGGRYRVLDPALQRELWMTSDSISSESSGYFLVPEAAAQLALRSVPEAEARRVVGAGYTGGNNPTDTSKDDPKICGCGVPGDAPPGMAQYSVHGMVVSLNIQDTPVGYAPPKGPPVPVTITYSQREAYQPANPTFFNLGPKWTLNWLGYIQDDPRRAGSNVRAYLPGGGARFYGGFNGTSFKPEERTGGKLVRVSGSPIVYERQMPDGSKEVYAQPDGNLYYPRRVFLSQVVDPAGNAVSLAYDAQLRLTSLTDALGQKTTVQYDDAQHPLLVTGFTDPFGRSARIEYDVSGRVIALTDVIGMQSKFGYAGSGTFVNSLTTPYGTTRFAYGESGTTRWLEITDPLNHKERIEYRHNAPGIPFSESKVPTGVNMFNAYINARNTFFWDKTAMEKAPGDYTKARIYHWLHLATNTGLTTAALESIKEPFESRVWFNYPGQGWAGANGSLDKPTVTARLLDDGSTQRSRMRYNALGRPTQSIDALGREVDFQYAPNQVDVTKVLRKTATGFDVLAEFTYNSQHLPLTATDAAGETTTYTYNAAGQPTSITNPLGEVTRYVYDAEGYLQSVVDANGKTAASYTYDAFGRVATTTDSEGHTLAFNYDALNRLTRISYPDGTHRDFGWDKLDEVSVTDREGRITSFDYDAVRNLVSKTDAMGNVVRFDYYSNGKLHRLTDANGNLTTWTRDLQGRVTTKTYADGKGDSYQYENRTSRLASLTDALGQTRRFTYARDGAQTGIDYLNALHPTPSVRFEYEADYPRLSSMTDGHGLTRYQYVPAGLPGAGLLARESGPSVHDVIGYTYDALGRAVTRTVDGQAETHAYDALGRLSQHTNLLGAFTTTYLGETAQPMLMSVAGVPFQVRYQYEDNLGDRRLKAILNETVVDGVSHPVDAFTFTTSPEGLILSRTENDGSADGPPYGWHHGWQHGNGAADGVPGSSHPNQGKSEGHGKGTDNGHTNGRWAESDGITTQFGHDGALRLTQATGGTTESYVYDPASNLTQLIDASVSQSISVNQLNEIQTVNAVPYVYDASGNLLDDGARTYTWDAADRLLSITDKATGHVSGFAYDGLSRRVRETETDVGGLHSEAHLLWCGQSLCEKRAADDSVLARYFPEGEWRPGQPLLYVRDQVGSVVAVVDASGAVVGRLRYSSYGNQTDSEGVLPDFRYAGLVHHQASGLELATYRAYAADVGRWLSRDPIRESGGLNLQAYATSLPNEAADPAGLYTEVIMLEPKGYSVEGFGHIAVRIDDKAFSFAPGGGMLELPFDLYIGTQGRNAVGVVIALTPSQENELRQALRSYVGKTYWPVGRNCTRPIQAGLSQLGLWNEHDQLPSGLVADLAKSPLAVAEAFYPGRGDNHASLPQPYSVSNDSLVATPIWVWALALSGL